MRSTHGATNVRVSRVVDALLHIASIAMLTIITGIYFALVIFGPLI